MWFCFFFRRICAARRLAGKSVVVFERLYDEEEHLIAKEEDIENADQTILYRKQEIPKNTIGEKPGIARNAPLESGCLIMHIAAKQLPTDKMVVFGRDDLHRVEDMQRIVGRMPSSKLAEEHVMQQAVHRLPHLLFHHHLQQDEIDATVFVLAPHAEARVR